MHSAPSLPCTSGRLRGRWAGAPAHSSCAGGGSGAGVWQLLRGCAASPARAAGCGGGCCAAALTRRHCRRGSTYTKTKQPTSRAMELVTGALGSLIPKLKDLLKEEYKLQKGVKDQVRSLELELESAHAALRKVAKVPHNQLDEVIKIWAREVREASYGMEDILDTYLVCVEGRSKPNDDQDNLLKRLGEMMTGLFRKSMERHKIAGAIENIRKNLQEVTDRRGRYTVDSIVAKPAASSPASTVDPRLTAMYREASQIIGIDKSSKDLISILSPKGVDESNQKMKIVSVVGVGGLGKTTLAKAVYDKLRSMFDNGAFVPVGQTPDVKKVLLDILIDLDKKYIKEKYRMLDERQLINELRDFLRGKRYFVVIDDMWEPESWETIKLALVDDSCGCRVIVTTRKLEVAKEAGEVYMLQPLSDDNSKRLFYKRLSDVEEKCPNNHPDELSERILKKCGGVPLAIITMASLLSNKTREEWDVVCSSPGFFEDADVWQNTMHILSLSYYDLPFHLKTCLLYLSVFPEDSLIDKDSLIWKWIAEGFVEKPGRGSFEVGEEYFHDLINRSLIQGVDSDVYGIIKYCRIHDMVLHLIVSMSHEQNFVSAGGSLSQSKARRLAIENSSELDLSQSQDTHVNLPQLRSFIVLRCDIDKWVLHPRLKLVRVLALENCKFRRQGCHFLEHIGNLLHLRYLGIRGYSWLEELPEGLGALKFLQTLNLEGVGYLELPRSVGHLTQLVRLHAPGITPPVGVIGNLTSLEELQITRPYKDDESVRQFVKDLGNLCELRVLKIDNTWRYLDDSMFSDLIKSLSSLQKMQHLTLGDLSIVIANMNAWDAAVLSRDLRCLFLPYISFPKLPSWINSAHLPRLTHLEIYVLGMDEQGFKALGGLPNLCYLKLFSKGTVTSNIGAVGCFQKLRSWALPYLMVQFVANEDSSASFTTCYISKGLDIGRNRKKDDCRVVPAVVMPNLEELEFGVRELTQNNVIGFGDIGLECLPSIHTIKVNFWCLGLFEEDVNREEASLRQAVEAHPNRPSLQIEYICKEHMKRRNRRGQDYLPRAMLYRDSPRRGCFQK